jgi:hypothetical protein
MPRAKRKTNAATQETAPAAVPTAADNAAAPPTEAPAEPAQQDGEPTKQWVSKLPDPFGRHSIDLGDGRRLQLNRSGRWQQMQIKFVAAKEGVDPKPKKDDGDTQWLRERGYQWRGDDTKAWTIQLLAPDEKDLPDDDKARRRVAADMRAEGDFIELAQRIRERNGLPPVSVFAAEGRGK